MLSSKDTEEKLKENQIKIFVWDWDYTLANSELIAINALINVLEKDFRLESALSNINHEDELEGFKNELRQFIRDPKYNSNWNTFHLEFVKRYYDLNEDQAKVQAETNKPRVGNLVVKEGVPLYPGMSAVLKDLDDKGYCNIIVSKSYTRMIVESLKKLGLNRYVPLIIGKDGYLKNDGDITKFSEDEVKTYEKPNPEIFKKIILPYLEKDKNLTESTEGISTLMLTIGDQPDDIKFGNNIGCYTVYISNGIGDDSICLELNPTYRVADHSALKQLIQSLTRELAYQATSTSAPFSPLMGSLTASSQAGVLDATPRKRMKMSSGS